MADRPQIPKNYDPKAVEARLYEAWERAGYFHEEPDPARPPFIIYMPPPNVTARAHVGHGSTFTPMDVLTRFHRMLGENANWLPGTDHAAIATEAVLIRKLAAEGSSREQIGRAQYLELAWQWSRETGGTIFDQFRALGFGPDWERSRFTMDDGLSAAVTKVFVQLYREGLIYRGNRLINWDPVAKTTISDAEIEHVERDAQLWRVRYPLAASSTLGRPSTGAYGAAQDDIVVATTRPETILGDVAIAVHPDDERYRDLIGKTVLVPPLLERAILIIADASVDPSFGTGAVKVTPAHDPTDYEIGLRHNLEMPSIMTLEAKITGVAVDVGPYDGLDRYEARTRIVEDLRTRGLLVAEEPYHHAVATSERSGAVVEPMLSEQWFVKMKSLAEPALQAYRDGRLRFVPERYGRTYETWLENIRDWNISRQVWWGHQLPVWYTQSGDVVVAESEEEARALAQQHYGAADLARDPDTLDTWFSSGLWPFSILGWPEQTPELAHWYPSQVLITGWEIIFLWVARMVMLGLHFVGKLPFDTVFIAPLVFDAQGRKMSKSLGNAIDPMDLVNEYGADAFRMAILRQMRLEGQEVRFQVSRCEEARNFNNKIWNATRYLLGTSDALPRATTLPAAASLTMADRWMLTRLHDTSEQTTQLLLAYDFGNCAETLWRFVWYEICDWYVEASKAPENLATRGAVLSYVLNATMRLLHPIEPFITEEVWLTLPHDGKTIVTASWPDPEEIPVDRDAAALFAAVQETVERLRNERAQAGLADRAPAQLAVPAPADLREVTAVRTAAFLANGTVIEQPRDGFAGDVRGLLDVMHVYVDPQARAAVLRKDEARLVSEVERGEKKLANENFVSKAAADVVAKEREKLAAYRKDLERVREQLAQIGVTP